MASKENTSRRSIRKSALCIGFRCGRLEVIDHPRREDVKGRRRTICRVRCDCGTEFDIRGDQLVAAIARSCGCLHREMLGLRATKHGRHLSLEYKSWCMMKSRCQNPNYNQFKDYGGRGVTICKEWDSFDNFLRDMGPRPSLLHSLDRFPDKNGNYEPSNCRWATKKEQQRNRRANVLVEFMGDHVTVSEALEKLGVSRSVFEGRRRRGKSHQSVIDDLKRAQANERQQ